MAKPNPVPKVIVSTFAVLVVALIVWRILDRGQDLVDPGSRVEVETFDGQDYDLPADSIRSFEGELERFRVESEESRQESERLRAELEAERAAREEERATFERERRADIARIRASVQNENSAEAERTAGLFESLTTELASLERRLGERESTALDVGLGLEAQSAARAPSYRSGETLPATAVMDIVWIEPLDAPSTSERPSAEASPSTVERLREGLSTVSLPGAERSAAEPSLGAAYGAGNVRSEMAPSAAPAPPERSPVDPAAAELAENAPTPVFTVPDQAVLAESVLVTPMFARVYGDDEPIERPSMIKAQVGRESLAAMFQELPPEITGMLFEGWTEGEWPGSCAKGYLTAASFIFDDGTIRNSYLGDEGARPDNPAYPANQIGIITDPWAHDCIGGTRHSDIAVFSAQRGLLAGIEAAAGALRQREVDTVTFTDASGTAVSETLTGDVGRYAGASAVVGGTGEIVEGIRELQEQSYSFIYVPSGQIVDIHLQANLHLDYDPSGRRTAYPRASDAHVPLD